MQTKNNETQAMNGKKQRIDITHTTQKVHVKNETSNNRKKKMMMLER